MFRILKRGEGLSAVRSTKPCGTTTVPLARMAMNPGIPLPPAL